MVKGCKLPILVNIHLVELIHQFLCSRYKYMLQIISVTLKYYEYCFLYTVFTFKSVLNDLHLCSLCSLHQHVFLLPALARRLHLTFRRQGLEIMFYLPVHQR